MTIFDRRRHAPWLLTVAITCLAFALVLAIGVSLPRRSRPIFVAGYNGWLYSLGWSLLGVALAAMAVWRRTWWWRVPFASLALVSVAATINYQSPNTIDHAPLLGKMLYAADSYAIDLLSRQLAALFVIIAVISFLLPPRSRGEASGGRELAH